MSWLTPPQVKELLREASKRGGLRAREIAEHGREMFGTGPKARYRTSFNGAEPMGRPSAYFRETVERRDVEIKGISGREQRGDVWNR